MEIRIARSQEEMEASLELSCKSFPISYSEARKLKKDMRQYLPSDFVLERLIIAVDKGRIVGVLRYYPRKMIMGGVEFEVLGLADYCVDETYPKNAIFGVKFLIKCSEILRKSSYPFALGSARRIMSNYYYRLGFVGCDTYCKCKIEKLNLSGASPENIEYTEVFNEENIEAYEILRRNIFSSEWGMVLRTNDFWRWIGHQVTKLKKYRFFEMTRDSRLVGYFVISGDNFIDYGLNTTEFEAYAHSMVSFISKMITIDRLSLNLSPSNKLFQSLGLSNISYTMRHVPDEGIIALGLNKERLVDIFCEVISNAKSRFRLNRDDFIIGDNLCFKCKNKRVLPAFNPKQMSRKDEQILLNSLFLGTYGPFSLVNFAGPPILPPTFFRINDLDAM